MPTTKNVQHLTDLDYDLAQLGDPLADDALDALSSVCEARNAARDLLELLGKMQAKLESGRAAYATREEYAIDLEELSDAIHLNCAGLLG